MCCTLCVYGFMADMGSLGQHRQAKSILQKPLYMPTPYR